MILFILPLFSGGGAERVMINLLKGLYNRGHQVGIIVFNKGGPLLANIPESIPIFDLERSSLRSSIIPMVKKIRQLKPKVLFSTFGYINVALLAVRYLFPINTKIWVREANLPSISLSKNQYPKILPMLYRHLYKHADKIICSSEIMKNEFVSDFLVSEKNIEILHNHDDTSFIRLSMYPIRRFDKGGVCYVASGRLTYQKGFDRLIKWFSTMNNKKSTLVILGDGSDKNDLIQQVNDLGLYNRVKFVGFCNNPWQWYAGADCFLLSSRWEGLPNVVLESLECGTRVISTI